MKPWARFLLAGACLGWAVDDLLVVYIPEWTQHTVTSALIYGGLGVSHLKRAWQERESV